jgi:hypothetical protein
MIMRFRQHNFFEGSECGFGGTHLGLLHNPNRLGTGSIVSVSPKEMDPPDQRCRGAATLGLLAERPQPQKGLSPFCPPPNVGLRPTLGWRTQAPWALKKIPLFELRKKRRCAPFGGLFFLFLFASLTWLSAQPPLTTLEYRIVGAELRVAPSALSIPKGVAGSVLVTLSGGSEPASGGVFVEAILRGPSFPARRLIGAVNEPLLLPPLNLVGDYQLDNIRLVDGATSATLLEGKPGSVPVHVFDEVLVSRVTSRPLTLEEIRGKGITIDEQNFRAVEFEVGFVLDGKTIPVKFPVVAPTFNQSTEIIPAAELEARLKAADQINQDLAGALELPEALRGSRLNIAVQPVNFQFVDLSEGDLALRIPPIPALVVIPGNIGFLHQFFSVQVFTENAAPAGSGLSVINVRATLNLPPGPDQIAGTSYAEPGDDPLRFARLGADKIVEPVQPITRPGPDGQVGTADDIARLFPGESGQGEFLVEGLQEGLHVVDIELTADLEGLAAGRVKIKGKAAGSVLVRNPRFSISFAHPRTIRSGEPYEASVTILNTSQSPANLVRVTLPASSLSGAVLESEATVEVGQILPGESATARFRLRAQRTGAISFSNLTTGEEASAGRFTLTMGVDERGVALSPDTLALPEFVGDLPPPIRAAAERVLGQALSIATAPLLPPGVKGLGKSIVTRRALELAEAGQRVRYGDSLKRVLFDLMLDWQGGRNVDEGFDQIVRETNAGREWREALAAELESADGRNAAERLRERGPDIAGLNETWFIAAADTGAVELSASSELTEADAGLSRLPGLAGYQGTNGAWFVAGVASSNVVFRWKITNAIPEINLRVLVSGTNGEARHITVTLSDPKVGSCVSFAMNGAPVFRMDESCDGVPDRDLPASTIVVHENPPQLISAIQDGTVNAGRPSFPCVPSVPGFPMNYGTIVAVLFSKPMQANNVNVPSAYQLENGNGAGSVKIQPGGRVALLNLRQGIGQIIPRQLSVTGVTDARGNLVVSNSLPIQTSLRDGVAIRGQVVRGDGNPAAGVPVTLTMYDEAATGDSCQEFVVRASQVFADANGFFAFDFVIAGVRYSISATDTTGLPPEMVRLLLETSSAENADRGKLLDLAGSASVQNILFEAFNTSVLPQAIAGVEGLDRALLRDLVPVDSGRVGSVVPVALRFRGRGTVTGTVMASDGVTPRVNAAVNLFPDPASRELGRGVFTDVNGRFAFFGVPLGTFSIEAATSDGLSRIVSGALNLSGEIRDVPVVLSAAPVFRSSLSGRVTENDNTTPHPGAQVFAGQMDGNRLCCVVAQTVTDASGFWRMTNIVADSYDVVAISQDGKRRGERLDVLLSGGISSFVNVALQGRATVIGRVETSTGEPVVGALVAGGEGLARTDANGIFSLAGVPTGRRTINAGVERTTDPRDPKSNPVFDFPRFGSLTIDVLPAGNNLAVIRLAPAGRIDGRVLDATGNPVPNAQIMHPVEGGFEFINADANGNFRWENLPINENTILSSSATGAPTAKTDVTQIQDTLRGGGASADELKAAIGEAISIFVGAGDPLLNGEGAAFNPVTFGFVQETLKFDRQVIVADIRFRPSGRIAGRVVNGQGVPIGAKVRLTSEGLLANGQPGTVLRGDVNSDPAFGTFSFDNVPVGFWGLQSASPFFPLVIAASGQTTSTERNETNVVLQFPASREVNGRLGGRVFQPDGISSAGGGVQVKISFGDLEITTETNGTFDTRFGLPAGGYRLEAFDPVSGLRGIADAVVRPTGSNSVENFANIRLLGKGALRVTVVQSTGAAAAGARVAIQLGGFPGDAFEGTADGDGAIEFENLFEGVYSVAASFASGPTTLLGRSGVVVTPGNTAQAVVGLGATATLRGRFVKRDLATPIPFAQVAIGNLGFATTDTNGIFEVAGLPLGTYRITSTDPVTGRGALMNVSLTISNEVREVVLVEQSLGEVRGTVINGYGTGFVPGARVTLRILDGLTADRAVTTGPDGRFSFFNVPAAVFTISAEETGTGFRGDVSRTLPENAAELEVNVALTPLAIVPVRVLLADGVSPATNAFGELALFSGDTDGNGRVVFSDVPLGNYILRISSRDPIDPRNSLQTNLAVVATGTNAETVVRLPGVGRVEGTVFDSDGVTPLPGVTVSIQFQSELFASDREFTITDSAGGYEFDGVPLGGFRILAEDEALASSANGIISTNAQIEIVNLQLSASGTVIGRLTRQDGTTPVGQAEVLLTFQSVSSLPGRAVERTDSDGRFQFTGVPLGAFDVEAVVAAVNGIARANGRISANGELADLGVVALDENDPSVVDVSPARSADGVSIRSAVDLLFSETLAAESMDTNGIFLRLTGANSNVRATLQLLGDGAGKNRLVRLLPSAPLQSLKTYEVVVIDGERRDALGTIIARGPTDLAGRPLTTAFLSTFTTADGDPPLILSVFPGGNAAQIDIRSIVRLSFNEPVRTTNFSVTLTGPRGEVPGTADVVLNGLAMTFTPETLLDPNSTYTLTVSGIQDLAGNPAANQPLTTTFSTLDTQGPAIATLRLVPGEVAVAGTTVSVEAVLAGAESGSSVLFSRDLVSVGSDSIAPFRARIQLPLAGSTTVRAIAADRFGNQGELAKLVINVVSNQPPTLLFVRGEPATGAVGNGANFTLSLSATDDVGITNVTVFGTGPFGFFTNFSNGDSRTLAFQVPADAVSNVPFQFRARAADSLGLESPELLLTVPISDTKAPAVEILSPDNTGVVNPGQPFVVTFASTDNSTGYQLGVEISGAVADGRSLVVSAAPNQRVTNRFEFSLASAGLEASGLSLRITATDEATNRTEVTRTFALPDRRAPRLLSSVPENGAIRQSLWRISEFNFDESLDPLTIATNDFAVTNDAATPTPFAVVLDSANRRLSLRPLAALLPGVLYTNVIPAEISDAASNRWQTAEGSVVPGEGQPFVFTTAKLLSISPTNGSRFVAGQTVNFLITYEPGFGAGFFRIQTENETSAPVTAGAQSFAASLVLPENEGFVAVRISASDDASFARPFDLPELVFEVASRSGDADGDGLPNDYELNHDLDPFQADASGDPDNDGLSNIQEFQRGTDPRDPDSDTDGLSDGQEIVVGTDPLNRDTDNDGIRDGDDPNPLTGNNDLDHDGIPDSEDPDVDGDGLSNDQEAILGTNPGKVDTDGDGWTDGFEVEAGTNPLDPLSAPELFIVSGPDAGVVLPVSPVAGLDLDGIFVGEPPVGVVLPFNAQNVSVTDGLTVSEPVIGLILPVPPVDDLADSGMFVSGPDVTVILPVEPAFHGDTSGLTVSEPVVSVVTTNLSAPPQDPGSAGRFVRVRSIQIQNRNSEGAAPSLNAESSGWVVVEWDGPSGGRYILESSTDLKSWRRERFQFLPTSDGHFRAKWAVPVLHQQFYRIRLETSVP